MPVLWRRHWSTKRYNPPPTPPPPPEPEQFELFETIRREGHNMAKEQSRSEKPDFFAKGGDTKMFGKGHAGKKVPGISGKATQEG